MTGRLQSTFLCLLLMPGLSLASTPPYFGIRLSDVIESNEPPNAHGYQLMMTYDPQRFQWRKFNIYFDGGFTHIWLNHGRNTALSIFSAAPVIHYTFRQRGCLLPYIELSIGLSYLNRTRFDDRNLGMHFSFQDRIGVGAVFGSAGQYSLGIHMLHYSNAHLSSHNSGVSFPIVLDFGYRF